MNQSVEAACKVRAQIGADFKQIGLQKFNSENPAYYQKNRTLLPVCDNQEVKQSLSFSLKGADFL